MHRNTAIFFIDQVILSQYAINANWRQFPQKPSDENANKIVDGEPTEEGPYPYQVVLTIFEGFVSCVGTLVDSNWVLSAAHCAGSSTHVR